MGKSIREMVSVFKNPDVADEKELCNPPVEVRVGFCKKGKNLHCFESGAHKKEE
jgi:hypothetical protein